MTAMAWNNKASLQLLVPPVRLMSAFMWKVVQQDSVKHYDKLLDFISLTTEIVPELLSPSQKAQLILGLRAKLVLELCRGDGVASLKTIQVHLDKIHTCCVELSTSDQMESADILKTSYSNFASLVQNIINVPSEKELFFKEVFPENYGSAYHQRIQQLVSVFLSRLEELLPVPDLQQTSVWLTETSASEEFEHHLNEQFALKTLLLHHRELGTLSSASSSNEEDMILSTLALSSQPEQLIEVDIEEDEDKYDSDEGALEDLDENSVDSEEWAPKNKSGSLSCLFTCSAKGPNKQQRTVREHVQRERYKTPPGQKKESGKKGRSRTLRKSQELKAKSKKQGVNTKNQRRSEQKDSDDKKSKHVQEEENLKNTGRRRRKEPAGEDKRFLSTRPVNKNYPEEEIKCPTCEKVFEHPNQLKTHTKLHSYRYSCLQCEKGFTSQSGHYHHQKLHKKGRIFICEQCNKGFLCNKSLKQHESLHDGPTNFCNICEKNLSKSGFMRHMQMHKGEKNYLCTMCGKAFLSSGELRLHNRTHTGELPYTCVHCGKGFSCNSHLTVHMRSHTGERPYLCSECPKRFLTLNCLKRHMLSHNQVKPFKCLKCEREFSQQGNLKRHMVVHKTDK